MRVRHIRCGPFANQSEKAALDALKSGLISLPGDGLWVLLTNVAFSVTHKMQSDEIDIVAVGPPGVRVIEVKHWTNRHWDLAEAEAERVSMKAKRVGSTLRKRVPSLPHVDSVVVLTQSPSAITKFKNQDKIRGVRFLSHKQWSEAVGAEEPSVLADGQIGTVARAIAPPYPVAVGDSPRRLAGYVNLELVETRDDGFHRLFRATNSVTRDRAILHLYDRTAGVGSAKTLVEKARWRHDLLRRLEKYRWAPRILDSFQDLPSHADEMSFFTVRELEAPSLAERCSDTSWDVQARLAFAKSAVQAVGELHRTLGLDGEPLTHGNLSADSIRVRHDNSAALSDFRPPSRRPRHGSTGPAGALQPGSPGATQVREGTDSSSGMAKDMGSLSASLSPLFADPDEGPQAASARDVIDMPSRTETVSKSIAHLEWMENRLGKLLKDPSSPPTPPARFWTEGQEVTFRGRRYRIVARLGSGAAVTAFKVVELHSSSGAEGVTYVAKVAHDNESGKRCSDSHHLVRPVVAGQPGLSTVFDVATKWNPDEIVSLMSWIDGAPLSDFAGVLPLLARDHDAEGPELAARWLRTMLEGLDVLHRNGFVHGDVSPDNMIVSGNKLVLTDYDCVTKAGDPVTAPGTETYRSPLRNLGEEASPAHDIHALAGSFFHVLCDREPFAGNGSAQSGALGWREEDRKAYPVLVEFLDRAVANGPAAGFTSAAAALDGLLEAMAAKRVEETAGTGDPDKTKGEAGTEESESAATEGSGSAGSKESGSSGTVDPESGRTVVATRDRHANEVPWLGQLLSSYPGARTGNSETRGLDSEFAQRTYVEPDLAADLWRRVSESETRLVILCGNAGDGKTALLQHLAHELGMGRHSSGDRIVERRLDDGPYVRMNLDGSASHQGRSAHELLDEFLEPFMDGGAGEDDCVHLLAINDGRLIEWIRSEPQGTPLKQVLLRMLAGVGDLREHAHIEFHHLNRRSRVGKVSGDGVTTEFLERLLERLYGWDKAPETWEPCLTCSAKERCRVYEATQVFGPESLPEKAASDVRQRARERLFEALQAVHLRGETHLTIRELRSALVYILFGTRDCVYYHGRDGENGDRTDGSEPSYWDRAFDPDSPLRQGEVLRELVQLDPSLEAHPKIDRRLVREAGGDAETVGVLPLASLRRRAYFEWTADRVGGVARGEDPERCFGLAGGRNLQRFREIPLLGDQELQALCRDLCRGIARIGDLPALALERQGVVPLRITPRTPTETAFWTEKPVDRFRLEVQPLEVGATGDDSPPTPLKRELHRAAHLIYRYEDGRRDEKLTMGADLFHRLLRLGSGHQLGDISSDDTFARLSIFLQRIVRENDREIMAWSPIADEVVHRVWVRMPPVVTEEGQQDEWGWQEGGGWQEEGAAQEEGVAHEEEDRHARGGHQGADRHDDEGRQEIVIDAVIRAEAGQ